jgi:hypothetical protein
MKTTTLATVLGTLMLSGLLWLGVQLKKTQAVNQVLRAENSQVGELRSELQRLRQVEADAVELARLHETDIGRLQEIARLRGQLGALLRSQTNTNFGNQVASSNLSNSNSGSPLGGAVGNWLKTAGDQSMEAQITRARERLNLSQEQEQTVRELVNNALKEGSENLKKVLSGQASIEDVPTQMQWAKALEQQILSSLTPEQQTAYQKYKREDISANARLVANSELLQLQNSLGLSEEQQDQVFALLYNQMLSQLDPDPSSLATQPHNPVRAAELLGEQKLDSLQSVLTASQLETYRQLQQSYLGMLKGALGQLGAK